jgi:hypothetical protein
MANIYSKRSCIDEYCKETNFVLGWLAITAAITSFVTQQPLIALLTLIALPKFWHTRFQAFEDRLHSMIKRKHYLATPSAILKRCYFAIVGSALLSAVALEIISLQKIKLFLLNYFSAAQGIIV